MLQLKIFVSALLQITFNRDVSHHKTLNEQLQTLKISTNILHY